jgi:hypothetical protein
MLGCGIKCQIKPIVVHIALNYFECSTAGDVTDAREDFRTAEKILSPAFSVVHPRLTSCNESNASQLQTHRTRSIWTKPL